MVVGHWPSHAPPLLAQAGRLRALCSGWAVRMESAQWPGFEMKTLFIFLD
jgi:hypothetical protein